ncbi:MAG: hypothetical protein AB7T22_11020 [Calditrichaceae bacterium]
MEETLKTSWPEFLKTLKTDILPLYDAHEKTFDFQMIHGRMHISRALIFSEFMCRYYYRNTDLTPDASRVRFAVAFHDSGRRGNGPDFWESDSAQMCIDYLRANNYADSAKETGLLIMKHGVGDWGLDKRIVHDADVLEIMRPCCGHMGRKGFRESALRFLGNRDVKSVYNREIRDVLIEEAWQFIQKTEDLKSGLRESEDYMNDVLNTLRAESEKWPLLADYILD